MKQTASSRRFVPVRRIFTAALAAVLTIACLFTAALAVSPELRTAVLSFLRMEEREQVPGGSLDPGQSSPDLSQTDIGTLVKAQYIKLDGYQYGFSGGLLSDLTWSEDYRSLLDARFWEAKDGTLVPADVGLNTEEIDITFRGERYRGELYWFIRDGQLTAFKGDPLGIDTRPEDQWYVNTIPGRTDAVLLRLYQGRQMDYSEYPILCHLDTGETEDILAGIDVESPGRAYAYEWSEDMRRVLILYNPAPENQQTWLCDLEDKSLTLLRDLTGVDAEFANFLDNNTLILTACTANEEDIWTDITCWIYDIPSGQAAKTLDQLPYYRWWDEVPCGVIPYNKNCLYVSETGQVAVIDLTTGARITVEGFTYQKGDEFMPSPSGNKLLYYSMDPDIEGLGITQLGVVDLENRTFIAFERDGYENLRDQGIGWSDDSTVSVNASTPDGKTQYLLLYQF